MSNTAKIVVGALVALVAAGVIWHFSMQGAAPTQETASGTSPAASAQQGGNTQTPADAGAAAISASAATDAAISSDLSQMDGQMNGFSSDNTSIDSGLNDKPTAQDQL